MKKVITKLISVLMVTALVVTGTTFQTLVGALSTSVIGSSQKLYISYYPYSYSFAGSGLGTSIYGDFVKINVGSSDGEYAYCMDVTADSGVAGTSIFTAEDLEKSNWMKNNYTGEQINLMKYAAIYVVKNPSETKYGYTDEVENIASQIINWTILHNWFDTSSEATVLNVYTADMSSTLAANVKACYNKIKSQILSHKTIPSYAVDPNKETPTAKKMTTNSDGTFTLTLSDGNGVSSYFDWKTSISKYSYLSITKNDNGTLTLKSTQAIPYASRKTITAEKTKSKYQDELDTVSPVALIVEDGQLSKQNTVGYLNKLNDPVEASISIYTDSSGTGTVNKVWSGTGVTSAEISGVRAGAYFRLKNSAGSYVVATKTAAGAYNYSGTATGTDGATEFYLSSSDSFTVSNLPIGTYTVTETDNNNEWMVKTNNLTLKISAAATSEVTFTDVRMTGSLKITKSWIGEALTSAEKENLRALAVFRVKDSDGNYITVTGSNGIYTYSGTTTAQSNTATVLKLNSSSFNITVNGLPTGTYTVQEWDNSDLWHTKANNLTGNVTYNSTTNVAFTNLRDTGSLKLTKSWTGEALTSAKKEELRALAVFRVKDSDGNYITVTGSNGTYTYSGTTTAQSNTATVLKLNSSSFNITVNGLPTGTYTVQEWDNSDLWHTKVNDLTANVTYNSTTNVAFTNVRDTGSLQLTKSWTGEALTSAKKEELRALAVFRVKDSDGNYITVTGSNGTYTYSGTTTAQSNTATVLKLNSSSFNITVNGLPTETYTVQEWDNSDLWHTKANKLSANVTYNSTTNVAFTNVRDTGSLQLTKSWTGKTLTAAEKEELRAKLYFYIKDSDGNYLTATGSNGTYTYSGTSSTVAGRTNFVLDATSFNATVSGLPTGTYTVTEIDNDTEWYVDVNNQSANVKYNKTTTVAYLNISNNGALTVVKRFEGASSYTADELSSFASEIRFVIKNSDGNYMTATGSAGSYTYSMLSVMPYYYKLDPSTMSFSISGLPTDTYTVTETVYPDEFTPTNGEQSKTVTHGSAVSFTFINTLNPGNLKLTKEFLNELGVTESVSESAIGDITFRIANEEGNYVTATGSNGTYTYSGVDGTGTEFKLSALAQLEVTGLPAAQSYQISETSGTDGYSFTVDPVTFEITPNNTTSKVFTNKAQTGYLTIKKQSADGILSGWKFRVELVSSPFAGYTYDKTFTTDENGVISVSNLRVGTYKVTEITTDVVGYFTPEAQNVEVTYGNTSAVTMTNTPYGSVQVTKVDEDYPENKLTGAEFTVYAADKTTVIGTLAEVQRGVYQLDELPYGNYYLKETKAPENYVLDNEYYSFAISEAGATVTVETAAGVGFENKPQMGSIKITKKSADGVLSGWKFRVELVSSPFAGYTYDKMFTTDENGVISISNLRIGTYKVTEITTDVVGYFTPEAQNVEVTYGNTSAVTMTNTPYGSVQVTKVDEDYPENKLTGAEFTVYAADKTTVIGTLAEVQTGVYQLDELPYGNYYLKETKAPANYVLDNEYYSFAISEAGATVTVETAAGVGFENKPQMGSIKITKKSADGVLSGWKFRVELVSSPFAGYTYDKTFTTDENGVISVSNLRVGTYKVTEITTDVVCYFTPEAQNVEVTFGNTSDVTMTNTPYGSVQVTKVDEDYPENKLTGAEFTVYAADKTTVIGTLAEVQTGVYQLDELPYGNYYLKETKAPANYVLDNEYYSFAISEAGATVTVETAAGVGFENKPQMGSIKITKKSADGVLSGWKFRVELVSSPFAGYTYDKTFTTDENGVISVSNLRVGTYKVTEITTDVVCYFTPEAQNVEVTFGNTSDVTMTNTPYGSVQVTKVDEDYPENKLTGAEFTVYAADKTTVIGTLAEVQTGVYQLDELPYGNYYLKETKAPANYVLDNEYYSFAISEAGATVTVETAAGVGFENKPQMGSIKITKKSADGVLSGWKFRVELVNSPFAGYTYDKTFTTDENGVISISDMRIGTYKISEIDTGVVGYLLPESQNVKVLYNSTVTAEMTNIPYGSVVLHKVDADNTDISLSGSVYALYSDTNGNGAYDEGTDTFIRNLTDDNNGVYSAEGIVYGCYLVKEVEAPEGYLVDPYYYSVVIDSAAVEAVVSNTENGDVFIEQPIRGSVEITKVDEDYLDNKLTGAEFTIYAEDKTTVIGKMSEVETGVYRYDGLCYGKYYLKETKAPEYYVLDVNYYYFEIVNDGETVLISNDEIGKGTFINSPQKGELKIVKTSYNGKVEGFSFEVSGTEYSTGDSFKKIYTTDDKGVIHITGLRVGEYMVSEIDNEMTVGYLLPANEKLVIEHRKTAMVDMYNEKIPDNPPTSGMIGSDGTMQSLIFISAAIILISGAVILIAPTKKRRNDK